MELNTAQFKNLKILITGGGGYLGSKLAESLVSSGADINLLDISFNDLSENLFNQNDNIKKYPADITNKTNIEVICAELQPDYIFHFSALLNRDRDFYPYKKLYEVNVQGTLNLLEALTSIDYKGFYYSSSSEVYGSKNPCPFHEKQIPSPASPYSLTKYMAENLIRTYSEINEKPFSILRLFNFFGPGMPGSFFINQLITALNKNEVFKMTCGEQKRDYIYIDDLIKAILFICKSDKITGEIINICSGKGLMLNEIAAIIAKKVKKEHLLKIGALPYRKNEVWEMIGCNEKLKSFTALNLVYDESTLLTKLFENL